MKIDLTPEKFATFIMMYLLDKINNGSDVRPEDDEALNELFRDLERIRPDLTRYYLDTNTEDRIEYQRMRKAFISFGYSKRFVINIYDTLNENESNDKELVNEEEVSSIETQDHEKYKIKEIVRNTINRIRKRKFYKARYLSEDELDKIIMKVINEYDKDKGDE
ncbi:MAG: hypothetical protein ACOCRK_01035 [bacterium]